MDLDSPKWNSQYEKLDGNRCTLTFDFIKYNSKNVENSNDME